MRSCDLPIISANSSGLVQLVLCVDPPTMPINLADELSIGSYKKTDVEDLLLVHCAEFDARFNLN